MAYPGIHKRGRGGILLYNTCVVGAKPPAVCEKPVRAFHCNGSCGLFAGRRQIYQQHRPFETYLCFYLGPPKEGGVPDSIIRCVYFGTSHGGTERGTRPKPFSDFFFSLDDNPLYYKSLHKNSMHSFSDIIFCSSLSLAK